MTPPPPFLRGETVVLTPLDDTDTHFLRGRPHLMPDQDEVLLTVRDANGDALALCGLSPIDWTYRTATLFCAPPEGHHVRETLQLLTRYALEELALETLRLDAVLNPVAPPEYDHGGHGARLRRPLP